MRKRLFTLALALALCLGLAHPALANNSGAVGQANIISAGDSHTGFVDASGTLWMWGNNINGELGHGLGNGTTTGSSTPIKVLNNVTSVSCGSGYTAAIKTDGSLWMWGDNDFGNLGNGTTMGSLIPIKVLDNVASVSCGGSHTAAIKTDGSLWMWGRNGKGGELGNGGSGNGALYGTAMQTVPIKVLDNVAAVSCGHEHTAAIKTNGSLWMWGDNAQGQLGNGNTTDSLTPIKVLDNVAAVSCGHEHTAAIKTNGSLWMWGDNAQGQLGSGNTTDSLTPIKVLDNVAAVSCGLSYTAAIKTDGSLWMWGGNAQGQLGNGGSGNDTYYNELIQTVPEKVLDNVVSVSCGICHTIAIKTDGSLWTWGFNIKGGLGDGSTEDKSTPVRITGLTVPFGVRLHLNGGAGTSMLWVKAGETLDVPTNPTKAGYTFGGWYTDEALTTPWNFNDKVVNTLVLYAKWVPVSSSAATTGKSRQTITLNGKVITLDAYTLKGSNGGDVTYVKLRDIAVLLENTGAKFNVDWRNRAIYVSTKTPYTTKNGSELKPITGTDGSYRWNTAPVLIDGITTALEGIVITDGQGGGHTFFKLRDLGDVIGFTVDWSWERGIYIETDKS